MCRLAAFPPGFARDDAIEILKHFENNNTDGTGAAWIHDREFQVEKYPKSLTKVLRRHRFLHHMPHDGWTIAHLRAASHGDNKAVNTHPFVAGKWAVCHNGVFSEYKVVKLALGNRIKFLGDTDSEAAAHLIATAGPKMFSENVDFSGVFLALNIRGDLWVVKTSGDLELQALKREQVLLASTFDFCKYEKSTEANVGWYHFDRDGRYIKHKKMRDSYASFSHRPSRSSGPPWQDRVSYGTGNGRPLRPNIDTGTATQFHYNGHWDGD